MKGLLLPFHKCENWVLERLNRLENKYPFFLLTLDLPQASETVSIEMRTLSFSQLARLLLRAELCVPKIYMLKSWPPVPQNATVFGEKVFKEVM